jgi:predicted transposase YbfD/YdcC
VSSITVKCCARFMSKRDNVPDFTHVKDPRARRGRRWRLGSLLGAVFVGMMALETSLRGVERLTRDLAGCRRRLGIARRVPDSTLALLLPQLADESGLRTALVHQIRRAERRKALAPVRLPINMVAIDGQTLWCSDEPLDDLASQEMAQENGPAYWRVHALHAVLVSAASQPCIDQMLVRGKTNEMGEYARFVSRLQATYGRAQERLELISNDAGMTSAENARHTAALGLGYLMAVKENQPTLLREAERLCGWGEHKQPGHVCDAATPWEKYRGARLRRELYRSTDIAGGWPEWESARQLWRVKQTTEHEDGSVKVENRYFVTNLAVGRLEPHEVLTVVRAMWGVENGCHWTLDVAMKQDTRPWCTTGKALRALSWLRLMAYNALGMLKHRYLRSAASRMLPWDEVRRLLSRALTDARAWLGGDEDDPSDEALAATL